MGSLTRRISGTSYRWSQPESLGILTPRETPRISARKKYRGRLLGRTLRLAAKQLAAETGTPRMKMDDREWPEVQPRRHRRGFFLRFSAAWFSWILTTSPLQASFFSHFRSWA
jgi:hypothetical protein